MSKYSINGLKNVKLHPLYNTWRTMIKRCHEPNAISYPNYGARGIKVCERWRYDFVAFVDDMGKRPDGYTLDRIDNEGDYDPNNCQWASRRTQALNKRRNKNVRSPYRGVHVVRGCYKAIISPSDQINLGNYNTAEEAALAYDAASIQLYGKNALRNFLD